MTLYIISPKYLVKDSLVDSCKTEKHYGYFKVIHLLLGLCLFGVFCRSRLPGQDKEPPGFSVVVVPQKPEQEATIKSLLPDIQKQSMAGGFGYVIGSFFSSKYAEAICNQYQDMDLFTVAISIEDIKKQHWDA